MTAANPHIGPGHHASHPDRSAPTWQHRRVDPLTSIGVLGVAAVAEIGGAWLVRQGVREHRGWVYSSAGVVALGLYEFVEALQPRRTSATILAAHRRRLRGRFPRLGNALVKQNDQRADTPTGILDLTLNPRSG